jgi:hypothetical protein
MTLKTNGNPYYLYLTRYNGINQCIFIDKKIQQGYFFPRMVIVKLWFQDDLFVNTLFSGEMVCCADNDWKYIIHDIHADTGTDTQNINLVSRLNRIINILEKQYMPDNRQDICSIQIKKYFTLNEFDQMVKMKEELPYTCRGIYFKPLYLKFKDVLFNFENNKVVDVKPSQIKPKVKAHFQMLKPAEENVEIQPVIEEPVPDNIVFYQKTQTVDIYNVYDKNGQDCGIALINTLKTSKIMKDMFATASPIDKIKIVSEYNQKFKKWTPVF